MRKFLLGCTATAALLGASAAHGGGTTEPLPEPEVIPAAGSSSNGGVIVPILLLLVLAAAASSGGDGGESPSDRRLKTDITWLGMTKNGLPLYRYRYRGQPAVFEGVMAQDVANRYPQAVKRSAAGWLGVDYDAIGLKLRRVA